MLPDKIADIFRTCPGFQFVPPLCHKITLAWDKNFITMARPIAVGMFIWSWSGKVTHLWAIISLWVMSYRINGRGRVFSSFLRWQVESFKTFRWLPAVMWEFYLLKPLSYNTPSLTTWNCHFRVMSWGQDQLRTAVRVVICSFPRKLLLLQEIMDRIHSFFAPPSCLTTGDYQALMLVDVDQGISKRLEQANLY